MCSAAASANQIIGEGATLVLLQHALFQLSALDTTLLRAWTSGPYTTPSEGTSCHRQVDQSRERLDLQVDQVDQLTEL